LLKSFKSKSTILPRLLRNTPETIIKNPKRTSCKLTIICIKASLKEKLKEVDEKFNKREEIFQQELEKRSIE
jgi:hypothetical protein